MALVLTGHALNANVTDFLIVVADDGTMRNCKTPSNPGVLSNGAAYTTSLEASVPHAFWSKGVSFGGGDDLVTFNQTGAYEPSAHIVFVLLRDFASLYGIWHHRQSGQNNGICSYSASGNNVSFVADGVGAEAWDADVTIAAKRYEAWATICQAGDDPGQFAAQFNSSDNLVGSYSNVSPEMNGTGTPQVIELGNYRASFGMNGIILGYIRSNRSGESQAQSETWANDVIDDARNGFPLMLMDDAAGATVAWIKARGDSGLFVPKRKKLLIPNFVAGAA